MPRVFFRLGVAVASLTLLSTGTAIADTSCSETYVTARAVRTQEDVRRFVQCAAEYVMEHGIEEARRAFHEDERWRHGSYYLFVRFLGESGQLQDSYLLVFPPDPSREGVVGPQVHNIADTYVLDYFQEVNRVLAIVDSGWIHYYFTNFASGRVEPKSSYVIEIDWNGKRAVIGAGIYRRDLPGTCDSSEVNAAVLDADPSDEKLQEFVRCAAMTAESMGYFAGPVLSRDSRWRSGSIYVFWINLLTRETEFSGSESSFAVSGRGPELLFGGRDLEAVAGDFGEAFWYYNFTDPATGELGRKVAFVRRVVVQGIPILVGSGYHLDPALGSN